MKKHSHGYQEIAHTADWALRVWAPDIYRLLISAVEGMYALSELELSDSETQEVRFSVNALDKESLLVELMSELLFFSESQKAFE